MQEDLTDELAGLAARLKSNTLAMEGRLKEREELLDGTETALDKSLRVSVHAGDGGGAGEGGAGGSRSDTDSPVGDAARYPRTRLDDLSRLRTRVQVRGGDGRGDDAEKTDDQLPGPAADGNNDGTPKG